MLATLTGESKQHETAAPFVPYIKPFHAGRHAMRFFFATPEARDWYDPIKPYTQLEYEWIARNLDLTDQVVLDVGTHHGHYALLLASMRPGRLVCVDAVQSNCAIAEANLCLNGFDPVIRNCAITTRNAPVQFTGESNGRVVDRGTIEVTGVRLPSLQPDATVVKLDIEGEEFRVLPDQLDEMKSVRTWIIEIHPWKTRDPRKLLPILEERYEVLWVNRDTMTIEPYPSDAAWTTHTTVVCRR